ncbi:maestro heat-like repeat-containing protein family member 7 [Lemur catta]|uniref:maestro heat-like repeat-containing protein family member 7 n=1 Tax=Lemur catta TaxID=9447 RepID=UPI001E26AD06|nr:maestro heat-like repeat-containing protein family member 7 [Lemur catta]
MAMQSLRSLLQASITEKPTEIESCLEAFAEYFTRSQLRDLVLEAIEGLTDSKAKLSLAAAQLMKAVMEERGRDMTKVEEIVDGILEQLNSSLEARTEEETLQAMCSLALSNIIAVVPVLLSKPLPWDSSTLALWKAFGTQRNTSLKVVQLLTRFLGKDPLQRGHSGHGHPALVVTCALCEMLSEPLCLEAVQKRFPRLLLAALCHLYWVTEQNAPQKMVVSSQEGAPDSESKSFDPTRCALEVVKLTFAAAVGGVVSHADDLHFWDLLPSSTSFHTWVMDLTDGTTSPVSLAPL